MRSSHAHPARVAAALVLTAMLAATARAQQPAIAEAGYTRSLFDGQSLSGWTVEHGAEVEVADGMLLLKAGDGWLRSDHQYDDFQLHLEWKALQETAYDAGIYIRAANAGQPFPRPAYQINLLEGQEGNIPRLEGATSTGLVRKGDWNAFDIRVAGETVALAINGKHAYETSGLTLPRGYVGFQVEVPKGGQFLIRNVRITELGHRGLFNGKNLAGWEGAGAPAEQCWAVREGLLECTGEKGPWLRSAAQYDDFNLRLDYRVSTGGNSGVFVRVPANGNHHRKSEEEPEAGFEVQLIDDAAHSGRLKHDYQYSASVYDIAGADPRVSRPAGEWNSIEINCLGQQVAIWHNGQSVLDINDQTHPLLKLRSTSGYLGLQNHGTVVSFRHIRIAPALESVR